MRPRFAGLAFVLGTGAALFGGASCATAPEIYVINETRQPLDGLFATNDRFRLSEGPGMQVVRGFPKYTWTLTAGDCVYRYPPIAVDDPYWIEYASHAPGSNAPDLMMRIDEDFRVRAFTYDNDSSAMVSEELRIGGLPMTPIKTCKGGG